MKEKFTETENNFDIEEPNLGHFDRFEAKLSNQKIPRKRNGIYKYITIAASFLLLCGIVFGTFNMQKGIELADVSPKMEETQDYFTSVIYTELEKIASIKNKNNEKIIKDAFKQLQFLEKNYKKQTIALKGNHNNKKIIFIMITNFQQRIDILQNLLQEINKIEQLKNNYNENKTI